MFTDKGFQIMAGLTAPPMDHDARIAAARPDNCDVTRGVLEMVTQVGFLTEVIHAMVYNGKYDPSTRNDIRDPLVEIMYWAAYIAERMDVDLSAAMTERYEVDEKFDRVL